MVRIVGNLMDEVADPGGAAALRRGIPETADGAIQVTTSVPARRHRDVLEFSLIVPEQMTVEAAHAICDRIERGLRARVGDAVISIHLEPEREAKHAGVPVLCPGHWSDATKV